MKRILLLSTFLFLLNVVTKAQEWFKYADFPVNTIPKDITSNNAGTVFLLTTENSLFYRPLGGSWTKMNTSSVLNINCISADVNNNKIYVGTLNNGIFHTSNFGNNWGNIFLFTNPNTGMHESYNLISNIRDSNLFFATNLTSSIIVKFTANGTSGQASIVSNNTGFGILDLYQTKKGDLLIGSNQGLVKSTDDGNTFIPIGNAQTSIFSFTEDDNERIYALFVNNNTNEYRLMRSDPANHNVWTEITLPESAVFTDVYYDRSSAKIWLSSENSIYSTSVDNLSWNNSSHNLTNPKLVEFIDDNHGNFFSFTLNENCMEHNSGSWNESNTGLSGDIHQINFGNDDKLFSINNFNTNKLSSLSSISQNWHNQRIGDISTGLRSFMRYDNEVLITSVWNKVYVSHDNGETFSVMNLPDEINSQEFGGIDIIKKGAENSLILSHTFVPKKVFISNDLGESWTVIDNLIENALDFTQDSNGNSFGVFWGLNTVFVPALHYSSDNGNSWNQITDHIFTFKDNIELISKNGKTYMEANGKIFLINSEFSLEEITLPFTALPSAELKFKVSNSGDFFITDSNNNLYKSTDNGVNWTNLQKPPQISNGVITSIDFGFDNIPFIIYRQTNTFNQNQGIYYFRDQEILNTHENPFVQQNLIYPNPSSDNIYIETQFRGSVQLIDFSGKIILNTIITQNKTKLNLNHLRVGVYILKFANGKSHKIIKK